jgi:Flp pilus assembly protein TadG
MKMHSHMHKQAVALTCTFDKAASASKASCKSRCAGFRLQASLHTDDEGSNLVEFALILPFLLVFLMGIFWIGLALSNKQALTAAVGIAAAQLSQSRGITSDPCVSTLAVIHRAAPQLNMLNVTVSLTMNGSNSCTASDLNLASPGSVTVAATYNTPFKIPMLSSGSGAPWIAITWISVPITATVTEYEY